MHASGMMNNNPGYDTLPYGYGTSGFSYQRPTPASPAYYNYPLYRTMPSSVRTPPPYYRWGNPKPTYRSTMRSVTRSTTRPTPTRAARFTNSALKRNTPARRQNVNVASLPLTTPAYLPRNS